MAKKQQISKPIGTVLPRESARLLQSEERFRTLVGGILDHAVFMLDSDGRVTSWNSGAERLKGYREEEILGQHFSRFYLAEDIARGKPQNELESASAEDRFEAEGWRVRKNGSTFWAHVVITAMRDQGDKLLGFAKTVRDLTERRLATERIMASEARLQAFMNHSPSLMFIKDLEGRYLHVNDQFTRAFGLERKGIISRTDSEIFPANLAAHFQANDTKVLSTGAAIEVEELAPYGDGRVHTSIVHKFPMFDSNGQVAALGGVVTDITERKRLEEALRQKNIELSAAIQVETALRKKQEYLKLIATHDPLTGVPNRALLQQRAEHAIAFSRRSGRLLAVLFIDLDRFKEVNDRLGHAAGDAVLREVAARLAGCLREVDMIARHGGDEFVALLEDLEKVEEAEYITFRMQEVMAEPLAVEGHPVQITSSIGVALCPRDAEEVSTLIRRADRAMYRAKELGRNTVQFYKPDLDGRSLA
jgi:diguanylate cyclase (GGDEF)-like protein/PAS domain S-box-containing protein